MRIVGGSGDRIRSVAATAKPDPARGLTRVVRVVVLGVTSLALAAGAHLLGGGRLPSAGVLAVVAFLLGLSSVVLTARRCRFPALLVVLVVQQGLLHVVFDTASRVASGCGTAASGMGHGLAGHTAAASSVVGSCSTMSTLTPATDSMASMAMPGWAMWAAHLAAVAVTAALLARGEAWLWRVADAIVHASTPRPSFTFRPARAVVVVGAPRSQPELLLFSVANPRGPPAGRGLCFAGPA